MQALRAAIGSLDVGSGLPGKQMEVLCRYWQPDPVRCTREHLAIGAVADADQFGIDRGAVGNAPAMTSSVYFHAMLLDRDDR